MRIKKAKRSFETMIEDTKQNNNCIAFETNQCAKCLKYCSIEKKISLNWDIDFIRQYYKLSIAEFEKALQKTIECKNAVY